MNKLERCYALVRERILDGTYAPGDRLILDAIARDIGVSVVPVREALRRLEAEGWIVYRNNAGARVAPLDPQAWHDAMNTLAVLEGHATALAAPALDDRDISLLRDIDRRSEIALQRGDMVEFADLNRSFHFGIYGRRCPNSYLLEMIIATWDRLDAIRRTIFLAIPSRGAESVAEHEAILDLIQGGATGRRIEKAAREHKLGTVQAFESATLRPEFLEEAVTR